MVRQLLGGAVGTFSSYGRKAVRQRHEANHDDTSRREASPLVLRLVGHAGKVAAASGGFPVDASSGGIPSPVPWIPDEVGIVSAVTAKQAEAGEVIAPSSQAKRVGDPANRVHGQAPRLDRAQRRDHPPGGRFLAAALTMINLELP